jgi:hypothetical protein
VKSLVTHTVFGVGLYVWGLGLSFLLPLAAVAPAAAQDPLHHPRRHPGRSAAESARRSRGIVVEAFDSVWLYTLAEQDWRPSTGHRVAVVSAGPPMVLSTVGQETRRAVLLVLHDAAQPWTTPDEGWEPRGACPP